METPACVPGVSTGHLPRGSLWEERGSGIVLLGGGCLSGELTGGSRHCFRVDGARWVQVRCWSSGGGKAICVTGKLTLPGEWSRHLVAHRSSEAVVLTSPSMSVEGSIYSNAPAFPLLRCSSCFLA